MLQEEEKPGLGFGFVFLLSLNSFFPSLPGESLMRRAALSRGGCAKKNTEDIEHLSLSSQSWLCSIKRLHKTIATWCFNGIYCDS